MRAVAARAAELRRMRAESQSDQYPEDYRERVRKELDGQIAAVNAQARAKLDAWAAEVIRDLQRRFNEGTPPKQEKLLEAGQLAERYKGQLTMARNHLLPETRRLLQAGATSRAAIHYRAATILGLDDSRIAAALEDADPVKVAARDELHAIDLHQAVLDADVSASLRDKFTAVRWGLTPAEQQTERSYREIVLSSK